MLFPYRLTWRYKGSYTGRTDAFVELKTSLAIRGSHDEAKFEKYVCQSFTDTFTHTISSENY
jgi:hypothetical protein